MTKPADLLHDLAEASALLRHLSPPIKKGGFSALVYANALKDHAEQGVGLTWDDVRYLRMLADDGTGNPLPKPDDLASRIAALLPPSEPWGGNVVYPDIDFSKDDGTRLATAQRIARLQQEQAR